MFIVHHTILKINELKDLVIKYEKSIIISSRKIFTI